MNIFQILLWPFTTLITKVFEFSFFLTGNYGISLILVSFFITLITAPLYILADKWKAEELTLKNKMAQSLQSINRHYTGSKKFYLTKTLQKIWGYTGLHSFKTSFGLILQIPFFFGAYEALTHYSGYQGVGFLFLQDLSKADSLFFGLALMPFIMTLVNILSAAYYSHSFSWHKNKSLYIMAAIFLVLLYKSPAALLVYWTMNNVFSILKTFILKKLGLSVGTVEAVQVREKALKKNFEKKSIWQFLVSNSELPLLFVFFILNALSVYFASSIRYNYFSIVVALSLVLSGLVSLYAVFKDKSYVSLTVFIPTWLIIFYLLISFFKTNGSHAFLSKANYGYSIELLILLNGLWYPLIKIFHKNKAVFMKKTASIIFPLCFLFFLIVYQPLSYYFADPSEIGLPLNQFLGSYLFIFLLLCIPFFLMYIFKKNTKTYSFISLLSFFAFLVSFLYANILKLNTGEISFFNLSNSNAITLMHPLRYILEPFLLVSLFYCAKIILNRYPNYVKTILLVFLIVSSFQLVLLLQKADFQKVKPINELHTKLPSDAFQNHVFSKTQTNVLFFITDMSNGNYLQRMIDEDHSYVEKLSGFDYYPDCLAVSGNTSTSLPSMLAGKNFLPHKLADNGLSGIEEIDLAYNNFFNEISKKNYEATITNPEYFYRKEIAHTIDFSSRYIAYWKDKQNLPLENKEASKLFLPLMVSLFNLSPWHMKYILYDRGDWILFNRGVAPIREWTFSELAYLNLLPEISSVETRERGRFLFIYNQLGHDPYGIDRDGKVISEGYPEPSISSFVNAPAAYNATKKVIDELILYFDWMKKEGIYDNTIIVIASDHGNAFNDNDLTAANPKTASFLTTDYSRSQALFMVKNLDAQENLSIKKDLVSSADIQNFLHTSGAFFENPELENFPIQNREERFLSCLIGNTRVGQKMDTIPYRSYSVKGPLADINSWTAKEKE